MVFEFVLCNGSFLFCNFFPYLWLARLNILSDYYAYFTTTKDELPNITIGLVKYIHSHIHTSKEEKYEKKNVTTLLLNSETLRKNFKKS